MGWVGLSSCIAESDSSTRRGYRLLRVEKSCADQPVRYSRPAWGYHRVWCPHVHVSGGGFSRRRHEHGLRNACRGVSGRLYGTILAPRSLTAVYLFLALLSRIRSGGRTWWPSSCRLRPHDDCGLTPQRMVKVRKIGFWQYVSLSPLIRSMRRDPQQSCDTAQVDDIVGFLHLYLSPPGMDSAV